MYGRQYNSEMGMLMEELRGIREQNLQLTKAVKKVEKGEPINSNFQCGNL